MRALLEGLFPGPQRSEELRQRLRASASKKGPAHLHRVLARMDRAAAGKIHPNDEPKLIRAIEVCLAARAPMTELWEQGREPLRGFRILRIGLDPDRQQLYARINQRAAKMFESGLVEETERLLRNYPKSPVLGIVGVQAGSAVATGRSDARRGNHGGAAGTSQLCEASDDVVPERAGGDVDERIRG